MPPRLIYFDNQATTRVDPRVIEVMLPYLTETYGNPHSVGHIFGEQAREAVDGARQAIAETLGARPREIVFTSGATESNNLAIRGAAERRRRRGDHLVSVTTEHKAVLEPLARLGRRGYDVTLVPVASHKDPRAGMVDVERIAEAIRDDTLLVSVMLANNEIGVLQSVAEVGEICKARGVLLHCDATQAIGKLPYARQRVTVDALGVDLLSFSAHKFYGPKGIGGLYVRGRGPSVRLDPLIAGGGHEHGLRSGTLNVPGILGMAEALRLANDEQPAEAIRLAGLRNRLYAGLVDAVDDVTLNGPALEGVAHEGSAGDITAGDITAGDITAGDITAGGGSLLRLPGNLNVSFPHIDGEALLLSMPNLAASSGAACTSADPEPSHVLRALGLPEELVRGSLRFSLGRFNTETEVDDAIDRVGDAVRRLRQMSSLAG